MAKKGVFTYGDDLPVSLDPGAAGDFYASYIDDKRAYPVDEILLDHPAGRYLKVAEVLEEGVVMTPDKEFGWLGPSYGLDLLFNRIWVEPLRIAAGFITEEEIHEIEIWNAYLGKSVLWTAVSVIAQPGTDLDSPTLPFEIPATADIVVDLTIYRPGPPLQDTTWKLTIDGLEFEIYITGIRVVPLEPEPNWEGGIKFEHNFETVMYNTARFHEQRRALQDKGNRRTNFKFLLDSLDNHRFFNRIAYGHDKIFGVPIFSEKMYPTAVTQGTAVITTSNSNEYMWNMQNRAEFVVIANHVDRILEIKEILNFTDYQINLKSDIVESFTLNKTVVYPCVFCIVQAAKYGEKTTHVQIADIDFREFIASG